MDVVLAAVRDGVARAPQEAEAALVGVEVLERVDDADDAVRLAAGHALRGDDGRNRRHVPPDSERVATTPGAARAPRPRARRARRDADPRGFLEGARCRARGPRSQGSGPP
jgi:hypothetical protein